MRSLRCLLLPVAAAALLAAALPAAASAVEAVAESFRTYKSAVLQSDGAAAAEVVTQESRDYFRSLADRALKADSAALHRVHISDRIYTLLLRHDVPLAELQRMSGADVVSHAIEQGWIGREGAEGLRLGNYRVEGEEASGTILRPDGSQTAFEIGFVKQAGRWRVDLVALMNLTRAAFDYSLQQSGMSEDAFVLALLEKVTGRPAAPTIWNPPS